LKLLTRTIISLSVFSGLVLLVGTPVFYIVLQHFFEEQTDETLAFRKQFIVNKLPQVDSEKEIKAWTTFEDDVEITPLPAQTVIKDSLYQYVRQSRLLEK
jgi:two-component system, OmpR family, sensor histidine kinase QseC